MNHVAADILLKSPQEKKRGRWGVQKMQAICHKGKMCILYIKQESKEIFDSILRHISTMEYLISINKFEM